MISPVKIVVALGMLSTVQGAVRPPPMVDQLQDSAGIMRDGSAVHVELNGCMKDDRSSTAVTCHHTLAKTIPFEVHANAPKGPISRLVLELPGGKENVTTITLAAMYLADLLISTLPVSESMAFKKKVAADFAGVWAGGSTNLGSYDFDYQATDKKTTLKIYSH